MHIERVQSVQSEAKNLNKSVQIVEDLHKLFKNKKYDIRVKKGLEEFVPIEEVLAAQQAYVASVEGSDGFVDERKPEMLNNLDVAIGRLNEQLSATAQALNEGSFVDPTQDPVAVLDLVRPCGVLCVCAACVGA